MWEHFIRKITFLNIGRLNTAGQMWKIYVNVTFSVGLGKGLVQNKIAIVAVPLGFWGCRPNGFLGKMLHGKI